MNLEFDDLLKCLNCGSCVIECPQYQKYRIETKSPRGKIRVLKYYYDNNINIDLDEFLDCKGCDKCKDVCPAGIDFNLYFDLDVLKELFNDRRN